MSEISKKQKRINTDERIVLSAVREFAENGFSNAKLQDIADNANVSIGLVAQNFNNKMGLFEAVLKRAYQNLHSIYNAIQHGNWRDYFNSLITSCKSRMDDEDFVTGMRFTVTMGTGKDTPPCYFQLSMAELHKSSIYVAMTEGQKNGEIKDGKIDLLYALMFRTITTTILMCHTNGISPPDNEWFLKLIEK